MPAVCGKDGWKGGRIFRLNLRYDDAVQDFADTLGVTDSTFILLDGTGKEVRRWVGEEPKKAELP